MNVNRNDMGKISKRRYTSSELETLNELFQTELLTNDRIVKIYKETKEVLFSDYDMTIIRLILKDTEKFKKDYKIVYFNELDLVCMQLQDSLLRVYQKDESSIILVPYTIPYNVIKENEIDEKWIIDVKAEAEKSIKEDKKFIGTANGVRLNKTFNEKIVLEEEAKTVEECIDKFIKDLKEELRIIEVNDALLSKHK